MHTDTNGPASPAETEGRLVPWSRFYDAMVGIMTLGHARHLRSMTVEQARLRAGEHILDVGCGTGGVTIPAGIRVGRGGRAAGIDPSPEMIAIARRKAGRAGLEIDFRVGVIEALPYPDAAFDVVTSSLMMHHLPEDVQVEGLAEVRRVLKPGGRLLIADLMRPAPASVVKSLASMIFHHGHQVPFGAQDLTRLLRETGFEQVEQPDVHFMGIGFVRASKSAGQIML